MRALPYEWSRVRVASLSRGTRTGNSSSRAERRRADAWSHTGGRYLYEVSPASHDQDGRG